MRRTALALLLILAPFASPTRADEGVVAYVEGRAVRSSQLRDAAVRYANRLSRIAEGRRQDFLVVQVVNVAVLSDAARRTGVAAPTVEADRDFVRDTPAAEALLAMFAKDVTPTHYEIRRAYDDQTPGLEYRARHILSTTENASLAVKERLAGGEMFETLARTESADGGSARSGGDLGWLSADRMVPELGSALSSQTTGAVAGPVRSRFGWHLLRIDETRPRAVPSFEQDEKRIRGVLFERALGRRISALRQAADIRWVMPQPAEW